LGLPAAPVPVLFDAPILLGFGVAVRMRSSELDHVRAAARDAMGGEFSRQDSQAWRPHVTIQNKVSADTARRLHREMESGFVRPAGAVTGLLVWEYLGGPWKLVEQLPSEAHTAAAITARSPASCRSRPRKTWRTPLSQ
jgi:2'-5' RNA ligase superfamily protein